MWRKDDNMWSRKDPRTASFGGIAIFDETTVTRGIIHSRFKYLSLDSPLYSRNANKSISYLNAEELWPTNWHWCMYPSIPDSQRKS